MSELTDDIIQESLEGNLPLPADLTSSSKKEVEIYQLIFEGLKWEPIALLQPDLSVRIIRRIKLITRIKDLVFYSLIAVITIAGATAIYYLFELLDKQGADQFAMFTLQYKWIFIYSLSFILIIQYLDQKISRGRSKIVGPPGFI